MAMYLRPTGFVPPPYPFDVPPDVVEAAAAVAAAAAAGGHHHPHVPDSRDPLRVFCLDSAHH